MSRIFECYTYSPVDFGERPLGETLPADFSVTLGAPVGAIVRETSGQDGNVGAHARNLSEKLGVKVMAYQDLGPKVSFPELRRARYAVHPRNFREYAAETGQALAHYAGAEGIGRTALRIHSGNGPLGTALALELHDNTDLDVTHMAVSDPAGLKSVSSFWAGLKLWLAYRQGDERQMPPDHRAEAEQPANKLPAFLRDILVRGQVWRTSVALDNLQEIHNRVGAAVLLHLPGRTFNGAPQEMEALSRTFADRPLSAPFKVEYAANEYHGSAYDSFARNEAFLRRALALAPPE